MAITKMSNSGIASTGSEKYNDMLAGNPAFIPNSFESIATLNPTGTFAEFTSIPSTYVSLQIRFSVWSNDNDVLYMRINNNTGSNYANVRLRAAGVTPTTESGVSENSLQLTTGQSLSSGSNVLFGGIIDIHDYASTTKTTTVKYQTGKALNAAGITVVGSGLWTLTDAVSSIRFYPTNGSFQAPSKISLYGIKGS